MRKTLAVLILFGLVAVTLPVAVAAIGLDVEAKAGAGIGLGSTDNKNITGSPRLAVNGGANVDFYLASLGPGELGLSVGGEYSHLTFHYAESKIPFLFGSDLVTDVTYGYFNIPIAFIYKFPVNDSVKVVIRAGGFVGFFLAGFADVATDPGASLGRTALDSSNTPSMNYGLHFTAGADIGLSNGLALAPAIQFDWGFTDISKDSIQITPSKDTLWALTLVVGIKYSVL